MNVHPKLVSVYPGGTYVRVSLLCVKAFYSGCVIFTVKRGSDESLIRRCSSREENNNEAIRRFKFVQREERNIDFICNM